MFAPDTPRVEGMVKFPSDQKIRRRIWPPEVFKHPAKFNCYLVWELTKYLTEPGQTIIDPMSGTGTTMLAALIDRNVILVEIGEHYHNMQQVAYENILTYDKSGNILGNVILIHSDCRKVLPMPGVDCIIFSPPYANIFTMKSATDSIKDMTGGRFDEMDEYSKDPWNVGNLNKFMFLQVMEKIYKLLYETAPVMAIVLKDRMEKGERIPFIQQNIRMCRNVGWVLDEEIKILSPGQVYTKINISQGKGGIYDESILILRR